jgi:FkbH-like protein
MTAGMGSSPELYWLPSRPADWRKRVLALSLLVDDWNAYWTEACSLAKYRLDFSAVNALDTATRDLLRQGSSYGAQSSRVAFLSSSTSAHLHGGLRVGALRHGMSIDIYEPDYGQYRQVLADPHSAFYAFEPSIVVFAFDAVSVAGYAREARTDEDAQRLADEYVAGLRSLWMTAWERTGATIIQQTIMPRLPDSSGSNGHRLPSSGSAFIVRVNGLLRTASDEAGIDLLALDSKVTQDGIDRWFSSSSWHGAKQEVALPASPMYGDMVARLIAARKGRSAKCCVFDLDNTLWGGVIGDDGVHGIVIGSGSVAGEAFLTLQHYALELRRRGILLAVCSKNDEANALAPFEHHPDMALKHADIACFVANWEDKAANIRSIAQRLNIGLDSLVFVDDNPFERELVRKTVPEVSVPEVPEDPALFPRCLSDAGYFEMVAFTDEDARRTELYAENALRENFRHATTDLDAYLAGLGMILQWCPFAEADVPRLTQLINKTNQFNLTTRRLNESEVRDVMRDSRAAGLQFRLVDRFGDNGVVAVVMGHLVDDVTFAIDDWLMSCRVLGRQVENATLNVVASVARSLGASKLKGTYRPTKKNAMVADLLARLGFAVDLSTDAEVVGIVELASFSDHTTLIRVQEI